MKKAEFIEKYGGEKYKEHIEATIQWQQDNPELARENSKISGRKWWRKEGEHYRKNQLKVTTGIPGEKNKIRVEHGRVWRKFKQIIAPESQIHHEWIPETANFRGVALVEADQHLHGYIDVIQILEGKITLLTEAEIKGGVK